MKISFPIRAFLPLAVTVAALVCHSLVSAGEIHQAADNGDFDKVKRLLAADPTLVSSKDEGNDRTPLFYAAGGGHEDIAAYLLEHNADINTKDKDGDTPLMYVVAGGAAYLKMAAFLLDHGADPNITDPDGLTPLHYAGDKETAQLLIAHHAELSVKAEHEWHRTPLLMHSDDGDAEVVAVLLDHGVDPNVRDSNSYTPLMIAAAQGHIDVVRLLLDHKAGVNLKDDYGRTAMRDALDKGQKEAAELLRQHGGEAPELTPLQAIKLAVSLGYNDQLVDLLKAATPDLARARDDQGRTALHYISSGDNLDWAASELIDAKADVNAKDKDGNTPLHACGDSGTAATADLLIQAGADINAINSLGQTPLHTAAIGGNTALADSLISVKASVNARDSAGNTPLHYAKTLPLKDMADLLRQHGGTE